MRKTTTILFLILSLCLAGNAAAVQANIGSSSVSWAAASGPQTLTVSGPEGYYHREEFAAGVAPQFDIFGADGQYKASGTYTWELVSTPKASKRAEKAITLEGVRASGSFSVAGGSFVRPDLPESADKDQVFLDDLIVDGSACVGLDCANGESFGFDTLKLKENNLRIKFEDTSASASFPGNDWQLLANESDNGGLNKFSIEDVTGGKTPFTVIAGAPTNSVYVDSTGNVGIGTNTPNSIELFIKDGDSPTVRLEQDGSAGFQSQAWDLAGNETNFFVRDVTNGSKLPFKIIPKAPTDSLYVDDTGNIGLNSADPKAKLHVRQSGSNFEFFANTVVGVQNNANASDGAIMSIVSGNQGNSQLLLGDTDSEFQGRVVYEHASDNLLLYANNTTTLTLDPDGSNILTMSNGAVLTSGGVWTNASSRELKNNIEPLDGDAALTALKELAPMSYTYLREPNEQYLGFIAEDVPEMVAASDRKSLASMDLVALLTKVTQEQQKTIEELAARVAELEQ